MPRPKPSARPSKQQARHISPTRLENAEQVLWRHLRGDRLGGFHFERRIRIEGHVFPFFCRATGLAIEIDRRTRDELSNRDHKFDAYLLAQGIRVQHFHAKQICRAPHQVAEQILFSCGRRTDAVQTVTIATSARPTPLAPHVRTTAKGSRRLAWIVGVAGATLLVVQILLNLSGFSHFLQGYQVAQRPLATLTPAPTRTLIGPSPTPTEIAFPTLSSERHTVLNSNPIFAQAERNLDSRPQFVIDLLLPQLSQLTAKTDLEDAYSYLGRAELALTHYHAAANYFKQLYSLEQSIEYLYTLAVAYDLDGDAQNALTSYRALAEWNGNALTIYRASAQRRVKELEAKLGTPSPSR